MSATLRQESHGRVLLVRFDNPPHNLVTGGTLAELTALVRRVAADRSVGAVVLTGVDGRFVPQYDLAEMQASVERSGLTVGPRGGAALVRSVGLLSRVPGLRRALARSPIGGVLEQQQTHRTFTRMNEMGKVFVAAINGPALGIGCELAVASDLRMMGDDAGAIGLPELTIGTIPGAGGTQRLTRLLGPGRALELMLEGAALSPAEAEAVGLVHRVLPSDRLLEVAMATADRLSRRSPVAVAALKRAVYDGGSDALRDGIAIERAGFLAAASQPTTRAALGAYLEEQERHGDIVWLSAERMAPWRAGTAASGVDTKGRGT